MLTVIWLMIKEEFRFHTKFSSKMNFFFFPLAALIGGIFTPLGLPNLASEISYEQLTLYAHVGIFFYGFSVASITFFGREYIERRFGHVNFLLATPTTLPWSFKKAYAAYFLHDIFFYMGITMVPLTVGGLVSGIIIGISPGFVLLFALSLFLSFSTGMALSLLSAAIYSRGRRVFIPYVIALIGTILVNLYIFGQEPRFILPAHHFLLTRAYASLGISLLYVTALFLLAIGLIQEHYQVQTRAFSTELAKVAGRLSSTGSYSIFLGKEILDIRRSNTVSKVMFSTVMPLTVITGLSWFIEKGFEIPLGFNIIFYSSMIGFFQVITYSWLNNTDTVDYYESLPVKVSKVIKSKIFVCVILSSSISLLFVIIISILMGEVHLLPLAIAVMVVNIFYIVTVSAYLTGLRTNSALFDIKILLKFMLFSMMPLFLIMLQSLFMSERFAATVTSIAGICVIMTSVIVLLYRAIERKWADENFIY